MGRIPDAWFDELRSRVNIVDVVSDYVVLKQKGRRFWGLCPFHGEKTASFSVDSETQSFYCFGCHKGGSVITFVMEIERMEFLDAVNLLSERAHLPLPERTQEPDADQSRALRERLYAANVEAARYYHAMLWRSEGAQALAYLHGRGLDDVGIRRFGLGAAPDGWDHLVRYLKSLGYREEEMKKAGLAGEKDGRYSDIFRNSDIIPIVNEPGKVLGFRGRILGDGNPKYLNTSDTPIFNKRLGLYAINMVKKERSLKRLILVEGYMDVVSLRNHGVSGVVATLGTALTEEQARLIKRYAPEVHVCYDGDGAGQKAILRALDIFEAADMPARVIDIPDDMDPDDYVKKFGAEGFEALGTVPPAEYRMRRAADGLNLENQEDRMKYAIACCSILKRLKNPVEVASYLPKLSVQTGFSQQVLSEQIGTLAASGAGDPSGETRPRLGRKRREELPEHVKAEMTLVYLAANGLLDANLIPENTFETPLYARMFSLLRAGERPDALLSRLTEDEQADAAEALQTDRRLDREHAPEAVEDCLNRIRRHKLNEKIRETRGAYERESDNARKTELLVLLQKLTNELNQAKTGRKE